MFVSFRVRMTEYTLRGGRLVWMFVMLRCGTAPLRIETGGYERLPVEQRVCDNVEDEMHFLISCNAFYTGKNKIDYRCITVCW